MRITHELPNFANIDYLRCAILLLLFYRKYKEYYLFYQTKRDKNINYNVDFLANTFVFFI